MSAAPKWTQAELWSLFDLTELAGDGLGRYLELNLERCAEWFRASGASLFLADGPGGVFTVRAKAGFQSAVASDARVELGKGIAGLAVVDGVPRIIGNPEVDPQLARIGVKQRRNITSSMVIPLVEPSGVCIGVLNLSRGPGEQPFRNEELEQARALGSHLTLAVSNARLVDRLHLTLDDTKRANERLWGVLNSVAGAVLIVEADGVIADRNAAATSIFGAGYDIDRISEDTRIQPLCEAVRDAARATTESEHRANHPDTDRTWLVQGTRLSDGGSVVMVQEITQHERALREVERMKRLAEIGQMTAAIAHEIRNPLTGIRAAAQMVATSPEMAVEMGQIIEHEALKLNDLCNEFLEFARPLQLELKRQPVSQVARRVCDLLRSEMDTAGVTLSLKVAPKEPKLLIDDRRIEQVLHNLIRNARQACSRGGQVRVTVEGCLVVVEDTGTGMDAYALGRLFTPFFTTKSSGTGLGLCSVRKIVDAHGGSIQVSSNPGEGTRFEVRLRS